MIRWINIASCVKRWSELQPDKHAILYEEEQISYLDLYQRTIRTSSWLQSLSIKRGDRVAVMLDNCPEFIELYLACSQVGAIFVPINYRLVGPELKYILNNSEPQLFVFGRRFVENIESLNLSQNRPLLSLAVVGGYSSRFEILDYLSETSAFEGEESSFTKSSEPADPEEPQVIMYTSGTTGQPKGAVLTYRKTFFNCLNASGYFKLNSNDIMLIILPLFHSGGIFIQASPTLYYGGTMIIHPKFDPPRAFQDIERFRVTKFLGVPTVYKGLLKVDPEKRGDFSSLEVCTIGGEKVTSELFARCKEARIPIRQVLGQTETSIFLWASEENLIQKPGTLGRPVFHGEVSLVDKEGRPVKPGEIGQLVVRGPVMMKEYWRDPIRTAETIKGGWLYTGDLAKMDEEGRFFLVDRAKDMYISGGENVYPAEVEQALSEHPGVEEAVVVGVPDETWGEAGQAFVIPKPESDISAEDLISYCDGRLARYKWPKKVVFCQNFPRTSLGKVIKSQLVQG
ncbi:MAG: AMP-binding protein [Desulfatiglandales bacterium]|nr:AMP-binding protein [Desulfatiglandales bacterium]